MQITLSRVAVVAAASAAAAASAVALALQAPDTTAQSTSDVRTYVDHPSAVRDAPQGAQFTRVARLRLPAGRYVLHGKALVTHRSNGVDCYLNFAGAFADAASYGDDEARQARLTTLNVHAVVASRRRTSATLECRAGDGTWDARDIWLSATRVSAIVQQ